MVLGRARALLPALVALACTLACSPERLPEREVAEERETCAALLACWYPGETGSRFDEAGDDWKGMAHDDNERNMRNAYGADGSCWQVDPMAGSDPSDDAVDPTALAHSCSVACACTIVELCNARGASSDNLGLRCDDDNVDPGPCDAALGEFDALCREP